MMKRTAYMLLVLSCLLIAGPAEHASASSLGWGKKLLLYAPNRILDVLDVVRVRVRLGPGGAIGVRATQPATVSYGMYESIYAGLPGPRNGESFKLPVGIESYDGLQVSVADTAVDGFTGPDYSFTEIGVSVYALFVGADVGVDPILELADLAAGILFWDMRGDDL